MSNVRLMLICESLAYSNIATNIFFPFLGIVSLNSFLFDYWKFVKNCRLCDSPLLALCHRRILFTHTSPRVQMVVTVETPPSKAF